MPPGTAGHPCPNCGTPLNSPYCASCGEKRLVPEDLSLARFFGSVIQTLSNFDASNFRTLRALIAQPGRLTADWTAGRRKPFLTPLKLFFLMNVVYFIATSLNGWNTLTTNLEVHLTGTHHQEIARRMVKTRLEDRKINLPAYRPIFDARAAIQAKSLIILMTPFFAVVVALLNIRQGRYLVEHLVFSLHFYAFLLIYLSLTTSLATMALGALGRFGINPSSHAIDQVVSMILLLVTAVYLTIALRTSYSSSWGISAIQAAALSFTWIHVLYLYRFLLFLVTYHTT